MESAIMSNNIKMYEEKLTPFGKSVLKTLVKHWTERQSKTVFRQPRQPAQSHQNKKILAFRPEQPLLTVEHNDRTPNFGYEPKQVPLSTELVRPLSLDTSELVETCSVTGDHLISPVIDCDEASERHKVLDVLLESSKDDIAVSDVGISKVNVETGDTHPGKTGSERNSIDWDNMFDTELFQEITNPTKETDQIGSFFDLKFQHEKDGVSNEVNKSNIKNKDVSRKRKIPTKITDTNPKKVKKPSKEIVKKNCFRKHKYTKAVKNWLNEVDASNPVEEEFVEQINDKNESALRLETANIEIETNTRIAKKKVVQTKLANKDGIMKFGLDKIVEQVDPVKEKVKLKKVAPKFIAPIKSQIPIKHVTFEIIITSGKNQETVKNLAAVSRSDVTLVLCYSNGYSQLNTQHTEDSCIADGIMLNVNEKFYYFKEDGDVCTKILTEILENNTIICYEGKHVLNFLKSRFSLDVNVLNLNILDAKIGGSLLSADSPPEMFPDLQKLVSFVPQYTIATECTMQKTAWYMSMLRECWQALQAMLVEQTLWNVFVDIEMRLLPIIADMEHRGVCVDVSRLSAMEEVLLAKMKVVEQECYQAAGKSFQINSAMQVRAILYDELKLDSKCNVKIKETICKGAKSTSESMLRSMISVHPLPKLILEYRHLHKAHATFLSGISQQIKNGVVKPTWVQTAAATGRIASNNPNLQAIPKAPFSLVLFPGSAEEDSPQLSFRSVYRPRAGHCLLSADFKHIECRVFAHAAADTSLLGTLNTSQDLFRVLAAKWLNKEERCVSGEDRERTKRIVYASLYGAGSRRLMDILNVPYDQALAILASFNRTFPSLRSFGRSVVSRCAQDGGRLATLCGRARRFRNIASADPALRAQAERQAVNFVVQGSAADLCKLAMVRTERRLRGGARLLLQIHDELVWDLPRTLLAPHAAIIKQTMEECGRECGMTTSLPVALASGDSWGEMTPLLL